MVLPPCAVGVSDRSGCFCSYYVYMQFPLPCTLLVCVLGLGRVLSLRVEAHFIARYTARLDK